MRRLGLRAIGATLVVALAVGLSACGGGDDAAVADEPGAATIGAAGGAVTAADGAQVVVPPEAFAEPVTVRISKDSTGAPPLPATLKAAGPVYAITPWLPGTARAPSTRSLEPHANAELAGGFCS